MSRLRKRKRRNLKRARLILLSICTCFLIFIIALCVRLYKSDDTYSRNYSSVKDYSNNVNITLSAVGDIMVHSDQLKAQFDKDSNSYSFDNNFEYISPYIESSDLSIANLETTFAGEDIGYSSFPKFNSPDSLVSSIKDSGFDIVSTINNHTYDRGSTGLYRTLSLLENEGLKYVGTRNNNDFDNFLIEDINGIKLGITAYSYAQESNNKVSLNGLPVKSDDVSNVNVFDFKNVDNAFNSIKSTLDEMNNQDTDLQVIMLHWGNEYERQPSKFQRELAQKLCDYGVDIIIGSHPHVVQPIEMIESSENKNETLVIYSLGNFLSNQRKEILKRDFTEDGLIVNININKNLDTNETKISNVDYIPTWVHKYENSNKELKYEILPILDDEYLSKIDNLPYDKIKASYTNTTSIIKDTSLISVKNK